MRGENCAIKHRDKTKEQGNSLAAASSRDELLKLFEAMALNNQGLWIRSKNTLNDDGMSGMHVIVNVF